MTKFIKSKSPHLFSITALLTVFLAVMCLFTIKYTYASSLKNYGKGHPHLVKSVADGIPNTQRRTHNVGNMHMTISNWGILGTSYYGDFFRS